MTSEFLQGTSYCRIILVCYLAGPRCVPNLLNLSLNLRSLHWKSGNIFYILIVQIDKKSLQVVAMG